MSVLKFQVVSFSIDNKVPNYNSLCSSIPVNRAIINLKNKLFVSNNLPALSHDSIRTILDMLYKLVSLLFAFQDMKKSLISLLSGWSLKIFTCIDLA